MSYVIHIWDQPSPKIWTEAQSVFHRLMGQPAAPNPRFAELAACVQSSWPELGAQWTPDAPDGVVNEVVWSLGLSSALPDDFYPRLVDHAVAAGLSVYDEQTGECFVPGPWRLSDAGRERLVWQKPKNEPARTTLLDVQGRFRALVLPRLAPLGFELEAPPPRGTTVQTRLLRPTPLGQQRVEIEWNGVQTSYYDATISCRIVPQLPEPVAEVCGQQTRIAFDILDAPALNRFLYKFLPERPASREHRASGANGLDDLLAALTDWLLESLVPVLDRCTTVAGFLTHDLGEPRHPIQVKPFLSNLALAHCAGVPDLDQRFNQLIQRCEQAAMNPDHLTRAHRALQTQASAFLGVFHGGEA